MKKLLITAGILLVAVASFFVSNLLNQNDEQGEITVILVDQIGDTVSSKTVPFSEEDTLFEILNENYLLGCADSSYHVSNECGETAFGGRVLLKIDTIETDWLHTFIAIYVNDEYSNYGIDDIPLQDGDILRFEYTLVSERGGDN